MSDERETRDHALSRLYREGAWPEPSRQIDRAILAASRRASRERHPFLWRFAPSFAIAATVVLTSAIVLKVYREQPEMVQSSVAEKPAARAMQVAPQPKAAEHKPEEARPATPPAPEPQAVATPQGFSSTMDTAEAARLERAQRDLGLKELSTAAGAQPPAKAAPLARPASQALKKESAEPPSANRERRANAPQTPPGSTFSAFGASAPSGPAPAPAQSQNPPARAAASKPTQALTLSAPQAAPRVEPEAAPAPQGQAPAPASTDTGANAIQSPIAGSTLSRIAITAAPAAKTERTPQAWIDDIRKLMKEGKSEEAGAEIAKFRKRYPDFVLPEDLR